jgi:PAS domain S-box-containing protein
MGLRTVQLRAAEARLWTLIANVPGAIYRCANDPDWTMELISDEIERISGYPAFEFLQNSCRSFASVIHPDDREQVSRAIAGAIEREQPFVLEYRIVRADGGVRWVLERGQLAHGSQGRTWLDGALFDITDRRLAEEALREREAQRARLEEVEASRARIVEAADAARRRLERDLHDGAQQRLVALALNLRLVRDRLDVNPGDAVELLDRSRTELELATTELRELARGLHPPVLTDRGLGPALRSLTDRMPIVVELSVEIENRLPSPLETAAYFMVAEALTNVVKHAQASLVRVTVVPHEGRLVVEVSDDGVGGAAPGEGSGLSGLQDRVEALDGRLEVQSGRGRGTVVRATIPCAPAQRSRARR